MQTDARILAVSVCKRQIASCVTLAFRFSNFRFVTAMDFTRVPLCALLCSSLQVLQQKSIAIPIASRS